MSLKITESDIEAYQNDGAVLIKGLLNDQEVSYLREGIEANISNPSLKSKIASNENDPGWFLEDFLQQCRQFTDLPLALGFGLSKPEELHMLQGKAEIAIVGTALLKTWEKDGESAFQRHLNSLADARD